MKRIKREKGKNSVTLILLVALFALFLRFAIQQMIISSIAQNESNAVISLKSISTALENYARNHQGVFPDNLAALTRVEPPYLNKSYLNASSKGYSFSCGRLEPAGYSCSAVPLKCKISARTVYTVTTGGIMVSEECFKKEER